MAKLLTDARRQRLALQAAMLLILLASLGLAEAVTRMRRHEIGTDLAAPMARENVQFRLPAGWTIVRGFYESMPVVAAAVEPADRPGHRRVAIVRQQIGIIVSPKRYLMESPLLNIQDGEFVGISMAGQAGVLYKAEGAATAPNGSEHVLKELVTCAVMPDGQVLIIKLEGLGPIDDSDLALIRQMASSLTVTGTVQHEGDAAPGGMDRPNKTNRRDKPNV